MIAYKNKTHKKEKVYFDELLHVYISEPNGFIPFLTIALP